MSANAHVHRTIRVRPPAAGADALLGVPAGGGRRPRPARARAGHRPRRRRPRGHRRHPARARRARWRSTPRASGSSARPEDPPLFPLATPSLLAWTMAFNHTLTRAALRAAETGEYDVIHAHDWLVTHTAVTLKEHLDLPLVATIHATEAGRHQGWLPDEMNQCIHSVEWWLAREACRVIVCSEYMRWEVTRLLELPAEPGRRGPQRRRRPASGGPVRGRSPPPARGSPATARWSASPAGWSTRRACSTSSRAVPRLARPAPRPARGDRRRRPVPRGARSRRRTGCGIADKVSVRRLPGRGQLPALLAATDTTVVPSLYEPFGMVALEAAAAGRAARRRRHRRARRDRRARRHRGDVPAQRPGRARRRRGHACSATRPSRAGWPARRARWWPSGTAGPRSPPAPRPHTPAAVRESPRLQHQRGGGAPRGRAAPNSSYRTGNLLGADA